MNPGGGGVMQAIEIICERQISAKHPLAYMVDTGSFFCVFEDLKAQQSWCEQGGPTAPAGRGGAAGLEAFSERTAQWGGGERGRESTLKQGNSGN